MARLDREKEPYMSHSKVALFERCPLCYYRQYILGEKEYSAAMELGSVFHDAARILYSDGPLPDPERFSRYWPRRNSIRSSGENCGMR